MGVSGAEPLMSTVDQALPVLSIGLHAAPPAVTCTWLAWRASGKDRAFAPCPKRQTGEAAAGLGYTPLQEGVNMSRYRTEQADSDFLTDVFKIALGVFIGGLLAALAYTKYMAWEVEYSLRQATAEMQKQAKLQAERSRKQAEEDRQRREAAASEKAARERQRAEEEQQRIQHEADMRAAWKQIYRPSPACQADQMSLTCANAHAAAHKRFMEIYGEMPPRF